MGFTLSMRGRLCAALGVLLGLLILTAGVSAQKAKTPTKPKAPAPATKAAAPKPKPAEPPKAKQWKIVTKYLSGGQETVTTVYAGGKRQRVDLPAGTSMITQCDLSRVIQTSDKARAYTILPFGPPASPPGKAPDTPGKGGVVVVRTVGTDTGERREMSGQQTRHLKLVTTTEPTPQACDKKKGRVETDGWFADIPELQECAGARSLTTAVEPPTTCQDQRVVEQTGTALEGFPLAYSITSFDGTGKETSHLVVEVTALTHEDLSPPLFEPPADFTAVPNADELAAMTRRLELEELGTTPKLAGVIRIGVAPPADKSGHVAADAMRTELLEDFNAKPFEAVPLEAATPADQQIEARKKECDYVVRAELGSLTTSAPGRVGGLVRRASGGGSPTELHEAAVTLEAIPVGATAPKAKKTASAKTGAFTWRRAVGLARFAGKLYFGMTGGMMMTLMNAAGGGAMGGPGGPGGPMGVSDPTVNALMMLLGHGGSAEGQVDLATPAAVVSAAFQRASSDVMKELQPK
jgi:hypothetical protein